MATTLHVIVLLMSAQLGLAVGTPHFPDEHCWTLSEVARRETLRRLRQPSIVPPTSQSNRREPCFTRCPRIDVARAITLGFAAGALESGMAVSWGLEEGARHCEAELLSHCIPLADPAAWPLTEDQRSRLVSVWIEVRAVMASGLDRRLFGKSSDSALDAR